MPVLAEGTGGDRNGAETDGDGVRLSEAAVAIIHEHDDVVVGLTARSSDSHREVGLAVAEVSRHDRIGHAGNGG